MEIDVALAGLPFEREMIGRATLIEFEPGVRLRICSAEDLMVLKVFADRHQDRADVLGIARRRGAALDWDVMENRLLPLAEAKEAPELVKNLQALRREEG